MNSGWRDATIKSIGPLLRYTAPLYTSSCVTTATTAPCSETAAEFHCVRNGDLTLSGLHCESTATFWRPSLHLSGETTWYWGGPKYAETSGERADRPPAYIRLVVLRLLISAPSLGVYYCQQLTLSVCPDVHLSRSFKLILLLCFSMESSHLLVVSSPCGTLQNVVLRFLI